MTTPDPAASLEKAISRVMKQVAFTGEARIRWEQAKATGDGQIFQIAQAHRTAEKELTALVEKAVEAYIVAAREGVVTLGAGSHPSGNPT